MSAGPCVGRCGGGVGAGRVARGACFRIGIITARRRSEGRGRGRGRRVLSVFGGGSGGSCDSAAGVVAVTSAPAEASDSSSGRPAGIVGIRGLGS